MDDFQFFSDLFRRYLEGKCSPEETDRLRAMLTMKEYEACALELIEKQVGQKLNIHNVDFALRARLEERLKRILETKAPAVQGRRLFFGTRWHWVAAACLLLILFSTAYLLLPRQKQPGIALMHQSFPTSPFVSYNRFIILPDNSSVVLRAGSKLQYPVSFNGNTREVTLWGEAYFDIASNPAKPFIIHTGKVKTTVLGTAFNIKADGKQVVVTVTRGKVKVEDESKVLAVLTPDQQVWYDVPEDKTAQQTVNANNIVTDWTREDMVFNGISFEEIAGIISKRYGVAVQFKNEALKKCKLRASF
ncbi:MAG: FecR domain-containing protein, partial [Ginsengibacter sp.]